MELCICLRCFALKRLIVRDEKIIFHEVCGLQTLHISVVSFVSSQNEEKKKRQLVFGTFCCLFQVALSAYLPDFFHKCILKQYCINHNITQ